MGLNDLSKVDVINVFSYVLSRYSVDEFLKKFESLLKKLYEHKDYKGRWDQTRIDGILKEYEKRTDAIKKDYKDKKIVHLTGSSVTIVGGILSFTPLAPIGWGLLGTGGAMNAITDVVDLADKSKQNAWKNAKNNLQAYVDNPFEGTDFKDIYDSLIETFTSVKEKISNEDFTIILQGMGWNYFLFRSQEEMTHEKAIQLLKTNLELFKTHPYTISTKLKEKDNEAIKDIKNKIAASSNNLLMQAASLGLIGIAAGIGVGATVAGINIANAALRGAETLAKALLSIGNFAMRAYNFMLKAGPVIAIIGGVVTIVLDSIAIQNIDNTFKPYYDYKIECKRIIDQYKCEYDKTNKAICEMYEFLTEDKSKKEV